MNHQQRCGNQQPITITKYNDEQKIKRTMRQGIWFNHEDYRFYFNSRGWQLMTINRYWGCGCANETTRVRHLRMQYAGRAGYQIPFEVWKLESNSGKLRLWPTPMGPWACTWSPSGNHNINMLDHHQEQTLTQQNCDTVTRYNKLVLICSDDVILIVIPPSWTITQWSLVQPAAWWPKIYTANFHGRNAVSLWI